MKHEIGAEIQKGRRRHDMLLALLMGLIAVGWATQSKPRMEDELASGYSALLYALPLMNTIIMPICMAVLASRLWDMEAKSGSLKLLFTLQSRESLFAGKVLVGMAQNALICAVEGAGLLVLGRLQGFTQAVPADHLAWLLLCTYLVNAMLFFAEFVLCVHSDTQVLALGTGAVFSLIGVFGAFMPPVLSYFMPWGYYMPLDSVLMHWDSETRISTFEMTDFNGPILAVCVALMGICAVLAWRAIEKKEV